MRRGGVCCAALLGVGAAFASPASAMTDADPDGPVVAALAEAAVARLGNARGHALVPTVRDVPALVAGVGGGARDIKASVVDLERAKRDLAAQESDLEVRIALPADVLFDFDKATIRADAAKALAHLATVIRAYAGGVRLIGHTDADGADAYNLDLSRRRADSVRAWLVEREGVAASRLAPEGLGETSPVAPNDTAENKQRNRRVDVIVRKQ